MISAPHSVRDRAGDSTRDGFLRDTDALHQVFVGERPMLVEMARAELGSDTPGLAAKVVEQAFLAAWNARTTLTSAEELHRFLVGEVHHGSVRTLSRRAAAHRLGAPDVGGSHAHGPRAAAHATPAAEPDVEQSWRHVESALTAETHRDEALAQAAAATRHEAAGHIVQMSRPGARWWMWVVIGLVLLAAALGFSRLMNHLGAESRIVQALSAPDVRVVGSAPAQMGRVTLDDGSIVGLAPDSRLTIPQAFGPEMRVVKLEGAATFEVAPALAREFQLRMRDVVLTAKGTAFIVNAYKDDPAITVVVTAGTVEVRQGEKRSTLSVGDAMLINASDMRAASMEERAAAASWHDGTLSATDIPLSESLALLKRWYGWTVAVADTALLGRRVTIGASLDSARQAVRGIEQSGGVELIWVGERMVLRDGARVGVDPHPPSTISRR